MAERERVWDGRDRVKGWERVRERVGGGRERESMGWERQSERMGESERE